MELFWKNNLAATVGEKSSFWFIHNRQISNKESLKCQQYYRELNNWILFPRKDIRQKTLALEMNLKSLSMDTSQIKENTEMYMKLEGSKLRFAEMKTKQKKKQDRPILTVSLHFMT